MATINDVTDYTIDELIKMEKAGTVFAKFGRDPEYNSSDNSTKGVFYPYYNHKNEVIYDQKGFCLFDMTTAIDYVDYGNQLIVFSFQKLKELGDDQSFIISRSTMMDQVFFANQLYVDKVLQLNAEEPIDLIVEYLSKNKLMAAKCSYIRVLEGYGYTESANRLLKKINQKFPSIKL